MKYLKDFRVVIGLVLVAALAGGYFYYKARYAIKLSNGDQLQDITVTDIHGNSAHLYDIKDKMVLVNFWASWCGPCISEMPELQDIYNRFRNASFINGEGFEVYNYSLDKDTADWRKTVAGLKLNFAYEVNDGKSFKSPIAVKLNIVAIPTNVLIDKNHQIIGIDLKPVDLKKTLENFRR